MVICSGCKERIKDADSFRLTGTVSYEDTTRVWAFHDKTCLASWLLEHGDLKLAFKLPEKKEPE